LLPGFIVCITVDQKYLVEEFNA